MSPGDGDGRWFSAYGVTSPNALAAFDAARQPTGREDRFSACYSLLMTRKLFWALDRFDGWTGGG